MEDYLKILLKLAKKAYNNGDIPVSAIIIYDGKIIGKGYNTRYKNSSVIGHAEINAIIQAERVLGDFRLDGCTLISSLKPCNMCCEVIKSARIKKIYYLVNQQQTLNLQKGKYCEVEFTDNKYKEEYLKLFKEFFKNMR